MRSTKSKTGDVVGTLRLGGRAQVEEVGTKAARISQPFQGWVKLQHHEEPGLQQEWPWWGPKKPVKPQPAEPTTALGVEKVDGRLRLGPATAWVVEQGKGRLRLGERPIEVQPKNAQLTCADAAESSFGNTRAVAAADFRSLPPEEWARLHKPFPTAQAQVGVPPMNPPPAASEDVRRLSAEVEAQRQTSWPPGTCGV